jgi:hypothetical protein
LRDLGDQANRKLLEVERISHQCVLTQEALDRLQRPTVDAGQRVSALRFGDPRVMALCQVIHRIPTTHRYTATSYGLKVALFYATLHLRILRPTWAALIPEDDGLPRSLRAVLDQLDVEIRKLYEEAAFA